MDLTDDVVEELGNAGVDTVYVSELADAYTLADNIENAVIEHVVGTSVTMTGNTLDNQITAGSSDDTIIA